MVGVLLSRARPDSTALRVREFVAAAGRAVTADEALAHLASAATTRKYVLKVLCALVEEGVAERLVVKSGSPPLFRAVDPDDAR